MSVLVCLLFAVIVLAIVGVCAARKMLKDMDDLAAQLENDTAALRNLTGAVSRDIVEIENAVSGITGTAKGVSE